jgi:N-acetyl-gamma-glutamyl-phosphate reductase
MSTMNQPAKIPAIVLGGTGYVAGELLRLLAGHPHFEVAAVLSDSQPGERVAAAFAHLRTAYPELTFSSLSDIKSVLAATPRSCILSAAPHGVAAALIDQLLTSASQAQRQTRVVDISADYRYTTSAAYEAVYKHAHGAPARLREFTCAVPEHLSSVATAHVAHPGCFATAVLLASVPVLKLGLVEPRLFVAGITGSTGSGRSPVAGTHHPQRHSDLYAYNPLSHRHTPEITSLALATSGTEASFNFIPHSGPFARGIHVTLQATARKGMKTGELLAELENFYDGSHFVRVVPEMPHIKDVAGSNYAFLSGATDGKTVAVMCAIDNLVKGAAGGALQWANRIHGFDERAGLTAPAAGWT